MRNALHQPGSYHGTRWLRSAVRSAPKTNAGAADMVARGGGRVNCFLGTMLHTSSLACRAFLIGAAIASISVGAAFAAPPFPRAKPAIVVLQVPAPTITAPAKSPASDEADKLRETTALTYRLTWLIAIVALGVAVLSLWQAFAARDASRRRLRAYVSVRPGAAPRLDADWTDATIVIKNHGVTPAFAVDHAITLMMFDYPALPLDNVMGAADKLFGHKSMVLAPGMEITLALRTVLSEDEKHETEDGTHKRLCAIGEVRYADAFKARHFTRFCFMYGGAAIIAQGEMHFAEKGNVAN